MTNSLVDTKSGFKNLHKGDVDQLIQCLPSIHKGLGLIFSTVSTVFNCVSLQHQHSVVDAGTANVQGYSQLHSNFRSSLGYFRVSLK